MDECAKRELGIGLVIRLEVKMREDVEAISHGVYYTTNGYFCQGISACGKSR